MKSYSDFIDRIFLQEDLLKKLTPAEPLSTALLLRMRAADDAATTGGKTIGHAGNFALVPKTVPVGQPGPISREAGRLSA